MARPRIRKKVCCLPESNMYGPLQGLNTEKEMVLMTVEEYETIRLIDQDGLTQDESAVKMNVARGTIQKLYSDARRKLAESLIDGKILKVEGGDYKLYDEKERIHGCGRCRRNRGGWRAGN